MSATEPDMAALPTAFGPSNAGNGMEGSPSLSPLQMAMDFWRNFDLNNRRAELDKQGLAIADRQEASLASRKQLSSDTRSFRKSLTDGMPISAKDVGLMLRAYQAEVDSLTNRAKAAETNFISLYKALYDAPDPVDALAQAARDSHTVLQLREQITALKEERGDLFERTANTGSLQKKVQDLEAQLSAADQRAANEAQALLEQEQAQWMSAQQKTIEAYELREHELIHQIRHSDDSMRRTQASCDEMQQQLNDTRSELEQMKLTRAAVNDMAVEDLEQTRAEANSLRRRCRQLENRLTGKTEESEMDLPDLEASIGPSALSAELAARDVQISQLKDQVSALEEVLGGKDREKRNEFAKLTASITDKDAELSKLRGTLEQLPSVEEYETMKRQFETLQSFQMLDSEGSTRADRMDECEGGAQDRSILQTDTLEKRLLSKVKSLESRLTKVRVDLGERDGRITELYNTVRTYEDQLADQKTLISKLEDGINAITGEKGGMHALKRRAVVASKGETLESNSAEGDASKSGGEGESAWDWGDKHQAEGLQNIIQEEPSMLDIVAGQRDRFRSRTMELEDDNRKLMERIEKIMSEIDSLKNDNVRLYEKLQFVRSYRQSNGSLAPGGANASNSTSIDLGAAVAEEEDGSGLLGKYRSMYEDMVNPYTIFNRRERHKRISEMSAPERLTLRASQRIMSSRISRNIVFCYILVMHVLIALVLGLLRSDCDSGSVTTKARH